MKKKITWEIGSKLTSFSIEKLIELLLKNRSITEKEVFLRPNISLVSAKYVEIDTKQLKKATDRINSAKEKKEQVIVFGDYDVDGITGTAILWETLNNYGVNVSPYIPSRVDEGYGLSIKGIENVLIQFPQTKLIITVDNGIVANEAVDFANSQGIDVIITDHHVMSSQLPRALAIVHTTKLCGAGVGWMLSKELQPASLSKKEINSYHHSDSSNRHPELDSGSHPGSPIKSGMTKGGLGESQNDHLALVALATVADLVPLTYANRIVLSEGLKVLHHTKRPGIVAMCADAGIKQEEIGVYEIGHMLGPRINAMGRISSAMDSLRLLCTKDRLRAKVLAEKLSITNRDRQVLTQSLSEHAITVARDNIHHILFVAHESYDEGVIGLMAGRMVEEYYRPSIVIAKKEKISKASARSVAGFNIIEFIRSASHLLINAGGHPMAAGFTIATEKIRELQEFVEKNAVGFDESLLAKKLKIDCELPLEYITQELYDKLQVLQPFGMGNPEPVFLSDAIILSAKQIGKEKQHVSFLFGSEDKKVKLAGIGFNIGDRFKEFKQGEKVQIVYTISENVWNDRKNLQLKIRDIR